MKFSLNRSSGQSGTAIAVGCAMVVMLLATPAPSSAQRRGAGPRASGPIGRAVPRGTYRPGPRGGRFIPSRGYRGFGPGVRYGGFFGYPYAFYGSGLYGGFAFGNPWWGSPYAWGPAWGYGWGPAWNYGWSSGWGPGYGYSAAVAPGVGRGYGGVRIDLAERDAEVHVDGYYAGVVDDFDGSFQHLNLEPGPHRIEVRREGFEPVSFEVNVEPGRTITYRTRLRPLVP